MLDIIDTSRAKWDLSKEEIYAINWLTEHGFEGTLDKQYVSKTLFTITRDGITDRFELTQGVKNMNIAQYMEQFAKTWELLCKVSG